MVWRGEESVVCECQELFLASPPAKTAAGQSSQVERSTRRSTSDDASSSFRLKQASMIAFITL